MYLQAGKLYCHSLMEVMRIHRYAFQEGDDTNEEQVALTATTVGKQTGEEKKPVNTDVFSLEDDPEEGKLE